MVKIKILEVKIEKMKIPKDFSGSFYGEILRETGALETVVVKYEHGGKVDSLSISRPLIHSREFLLRFIKEHVRPKRPPRERRRGPSSKQLKELEGKEFEVR